MTTSTPRAEAAFGEPPRSSTGGSLLVGTAAGELPEHERARLQFDAWIAIGDPGLAGVTETSGPCYSRENGLWVTIDWRDARHAPEVRWQALALLQSAQMNRPAVNGPLVLPPNPLVSGEGLGRAPTSDKEPERS